MTDDSARGPQLGGSTHGEPPRVILVGVDFGRGSSFDPTLDELALLAESADDIPVARVTARRKAPAWSS